MRRGAIGAGAERGGVGGLASVCGRRLNFFFFPTHLFRSTTRYQAHDADGKASLGDVVRLDPIRPMSKTKRFAVAEVVKKGE